MVVQALQQVLDVVKIREVDLEDLQELSLTLWQLLRGQLKSLKIFRKENTHQEYKKTVREQKQVLNPTRCKAMVVVQKKKLTSASPLYRLKTWS